MLPKDKLNSVETLISLALIYLKISHVEFKKVFHEKGKYEKTQENIRMMKRADKKDELSKTNKNIR